MSYYSEHPHLKEYARKYGQTLTGKYFCYRGKAMERGYIWDLSKKDFAKLWQKPCYYCGSKINTIGIDRVDNRKGYVKENIVPCCGICNKAKLEMSEKEFIDHCLKIVEYYFGKNGD